MRFFIITLIFTTSFGAIIHGVQKRAKGDLGKITLASELSWIKYSKVINSKRVHLLTRFWYLDLVTVMLVTTLCWFYHGERV